MIGSPPAYAEAARESGEKPPMPRQIAWHLDFTFTVLKEVPLEKAAVKNKLRQ